MFKVGIVGAGFIGRKRAEIAARVAAARKAQQQLFHLEVWMLV